MGARPRLGVDLVEVGAAGGEVVGEEIGDGHDLGDGVLRERRGDGRAAVAAAQQAMAHGGVGLVAEGGERFEQSDAGSGCGSGLDEFATIHGVLSSLFAMLNCVRLGR